MRDFRLLPKHVFGSAFRQNGIRSFREAVEYVRALPYGRPQRLPHALAVLEEKRGTCSSKHALLKALADEHGYSQIELVYCLFLMTSTNTPAVNAVLDAGPLSAIPEAHLHLRWAGENIDATSASIHVDRLLQDRLHQRIMRLSEVPAKSAWHKKDLQTWLHEHAPTVSLAAAWQQREHAIALLAHEAST